MKLVSINIELNKHNNTVLNFLKQEKPEVVCFQELLEEDFDYFKKELNLNGVFSPFRYVHSLHYKDLNGKKFGVGIFAKNIVNSGSVFYFNNEKSILGSYEEYLSDENNKNNSILLWADIENDSGKLFKFITTHPPVTKEGEYSPLQVRVFDELLKALDPIPEFILCGDINAPRGNGAFKRLNEKYKDDIPLEYKTSIDQNLHKVKGIQFMVDCLFTTPIYKALNVRLVDGVSDHMAIMADIE